MGLSPRFCEDLQRGNIMNVENTKKVLDAIEAERGTRFKMSVWGWNSTHLDTTNPEVVDCGTSMCLAGWANYLSWKEDKDECRQLDDTKHAHRWLGMGDNFESRSCADYSSPFAYHHDSDAALESLRKCVRDRSWAKYLDYIKEYED